MFIEAKDDVGGGDNWTTGAISRANLQSNHHHQQTKIQFFYRPDALPVPNQQCQSTEGKTYSSLIYFLAISGCIMVLLSAVLFSCYCRNAMLLMLPNTSLQMMRAVFRVFLLTQMMNVKEIYTLYK